MMQMFWMDDDATMTKAVVGDGTVTYNTLHYWTYCIAIHVCNTPGKRSGEPPLGLVLLWLANLSVSLFPEVFKDLIDAVDVTHSGLSADPINHHRPFERVEVTLRLGEDLVGSGMRAP